MGWHASRPTLTRIASCTTLFRNRDKDTELLFFYSITLFVNAALLFVIEPMVAKMILPFLGGSPAVWNTSLMFYQGCLLAGYAYAHFGSSWLGTRRHAYVHLVSCVSRVVALTSCSSAPLADGTDAQPVSLVLAVRSWLPIFDLVGRPALDAEMVLPTACTALPAILLLVRRK